VGSESCPEQLRFPAVSIKELIVAWSPAPLTLGDASWFTLPQTETGRMTVVFRDLDARFEFPYYLIIATPDSVLPRMQKFPRCRRQQTANWTPRVSLPTISIWSRGTSTA